MIVDTTIEDEVLVTMVLKKPFTMEQRAEFDQILDHCFGFEEDYNRKVTNEIST